MKSKYIKPSAECLPCMALGLLEESVKTVTFDPTDGTTEALSKEADLVDEEIDGDKVTDSRMQYNIGPKGSNWYESLDNLMD